MELGGINSTQIVGQFQFRQIGREGKTLTPGVVEMANCTPETCVPPCRGADLWLVSSYLADVSISQPLMHVGEAWD